MEDEQEEEEEEEEEREAKSEVGIIQIEASLPAKRDTNWRRERTYWYRMIH